MSQRTYRFNGQVHPISAPHLDDEAVAGKVRMLMRNDLDHEAVVTIARDRILCLVGENARLRAEVRRLERAIDAKV